MTMHYAPPVGRTALLIVAALLLLWPGAQVASACCGPELDDESGSFSDFYDSGTGGSAPAGEGITTTTTTTWTQEFSDGEPEITEQVKTAEYCPVVASSDDDNDDEEEEEEGGVAIDLSEADFGEDLVLPPGLEGMNVDDLLDDNADFQDMQDATDFGFDPDQLQQVEDDCSGCLCDDSCNDGEEGW